MTRLIDPYVEQQYNNRAAVPDHVRYMSSWKSRSEAFRAGGKGYLNIAYGPSSRQFVDIFPVENQQKAPLHVFIHGGYWQALDKDSFSFMAETFNQNGQCAVIVNYDLCPAVSLQEIIIQLEQAIGWINQNISDYGGDPAQVQITGHSAGAHLLAMLLTTDWSDRGLNDYPFKQLNGISGLYDLRPLIATSVNQALALDEKASLQASPAFGKLWKPSKSIQLNVVVGELESREYKKQSRLICKTWEDKLTVQHLQLPGCHHFSILDRFLDSDVWKYI